MQLFDRSARTGRGWMLRTVLWALCPLIVTGCDGCRQEVPYDPDSPAATIREKNIHVPVEPGDDYVRDNIDFTRIKINYSEREGKKSIRAFTEASRSTEVDRDDAKWDYTLQLKFRFMKGDKTLAEALRSGDFEGEVTLNELCGTKIKEVPDRVVVEKVNVTKEAKKLPPKESTD